MLNECLKNFNQHSESSVLKLLYVIFVCLLSRPSSSRHKLSHYTPFKVNRNTFKAKTYIFKAKTNTFNAETNTFTAKSYTFKVKTYTFKATTTTFKTKTNTFEVMRYILKVKIYTTFKYSNEMSSKMTRNMLKSKVLL